MHTTFDAIGPTLSFVPELNVDETLYSWCGRTSDLNARPGATIVSKRLFNSLYAALAHDIPSHLEWLVEESASPSGNAIALARSNTLAGFYLPWQCEASADIIIRHLLTGQPKDVKLYLGLPASRLAALHPLKACPSCMRTDLERFGYSYWHIRHQSPASWICHEHDQLLQTAVLRKTPKRYREWHAPDSVTLQRRSVVASQSGHQMLRRLEQFSEELRSLPVSSLQQNQLAITYRQVLRDRDLATDKGQLRLKKIVPLMRFQYEGLRGVPGFQVLDGISDEWAGFIGNAARRQAKPAHPFKHLLLIALLFDNWTDFLDAYAESPRIEPITPSSIDTELRIEKRKDEFCKLVIELGLSLSAAGRQIGVTPTTAVSWAKQRGLTFTRRTKSLDESVLKECRKMLRQGIRRQDIAKVLPISPTSITRLLSYEPKLRIAWQSAIHENFRRRNRKQFLHLLGEHPGVPIKLIRKIPGNGYAWLYRNDRRWLSAHLPMFDPKSSPSADQR